MRLLLAAVATLAACAGDKDEAPRPPPANPPVPGVLVRGDAGITAVVTGVVPGDSGNDDSTGAARPPQAFLRGSRPGRPIDVTLRSTPPGAQVAVDGTVIGNTPSFWSGMADGHEHEFVFTMRGHAIARYRFVPVASGVIHGRLDPIRERPDASMLPPPEVVPPRPTRAPMASSPAAPPAVRGDASAAPAPETSPIPGPVGPTPSAETVERPPVGPSP